MQRLGLASSVSAAVLLAAAAGPAAAQYPGYGPYGQSYGPGYRPQLSPYLNLLRGGNSPAAPAANYFLGTLPEFQRRANAAAFSSAITGIDQRLASPGMSVYEEERLLTPLPGTGHPTAFGTTVTYFGQNTLPAGTGRQAAGGYGAQQGPRPPRGGGGR